MKIGDMPLFKEASTKDQYKEEWCECLFGKKVRFPREFTEAQLRRLTSDLLMQHDRIIRESAEIIRNTGDEDTRLSRIELMRMNYYEGMLRLRPFCSDEQQSVIKDAEEIVESIL